MYCSLCLNLVDVPAFTYPSLFCSKAEDEEETDDGFAEAKDDLATKNGMASAAEEPENLKDEVTLLLLMFSELRSVVKVFLCRLRPVLLRFLPQLFIMPNYKD